MPREARHVICPGAAVPPRRSRPAHPARQRPRRGRGARHERLGEFRPGLTRTPARGVHRRSLGERPRHPGGRTARPGRRGRAPAQVLPRRAGRAGRPRRRRDPLAALLAPGSGRQSLLARRGRGGRSADDRVHRPVRYLGRHPPARGRRAARARRVRGARAVAAHCRALPAGRVRPHRAYRDRVPGPGPGPARPGRAAGPWPEGTPLSRHQRLPLVRRARPGGDRLHRG
jgi:hypothetical protein